MSDFNDTMQMATYTFDQVGVRFDSADPRFDKDIHIDAADIAPTAAGTQSIRNDQQLERVFFSQRPVCYSNL